MKWITNRKIKNVFCAVVVIVSVLACAADSFAFLYEVKLLTPGELTRLSNDALIDTYIDAAVEIQASTLFHRSSGFKPSEYKQFKGLLKYRILLLQEFKKRKLELPPIDTLPSLTEMEE